MSLLAGTDEQSSRPASLQSVVGDGPSYAARSPPLSAGARHGSGARPPPRSAAQDSRTEEPCTPCTGSAPCGYWRRSSGERCAPATQRRDHLRPVRPAARAGSRPHAARRGVGEAIMSDPQRYRQRPGRCSARRPGPWTTPTCAFCVGWPSRAVWNTLPSACPAANWPPECSRVAGNYRGDSAPRDQAGPARGGAATRA